MEKTMTTKTFRSIEDEIERRICQGKDTSLAELKAIIGKHSKEPFKLEIKDYGEVATLYYLYSGAAKPPFEWDTCDALTVMKTIETIRRNHGN
jgi:hypothetical protein